MEFLLLRQIIVLLASIVAAYTDWKDGNIYNHTTYSLIILGIVLFVIDFELTTILIAGAVFAISYLLYYAGKVGGGDVKLFTGISLVLPQLGNYPFILSVLFVSAILAMTFLSLYYVIKYINKGINLEENSHRIKQAVILGLILAVYFYILLSTSIVKMNYLLVVGVPLFFALIFFGLEKGIRKEFFLKKVKISDLEEDDLIAYDFLDEKMQKSLKLGLKGIIDKKLRNKLENLKIKNILVYKNLPKFAPFILIAEIVVFVFPNILDLVFIGV